MKKLNYEKTFYSILIVMIIIWAFALVSLLFGFDTPQYSRSKTISENEEYLYQWTNKLKNGTAFNNLCFSDGTCMTSAGVGSISVYTNPNYLTGSGILSSPLSVNSDNVTIQGNTFNSANKLLQLDGTGLIPSYLIPTLDYLLKTGDTMSGHLNMGGNNVLNVSTISINGNGYTNYIYGNASQNDNITYILPYSTDIAEGSYLTYGSNGQLSWQQPAIAGEDNLGNHIATTSLNMSGYDINNANYITAVKYYGDGSELTNISGDNLGNHIATMTLTTDYGINTSTIQTKNILVYDAQPYINILSLNYLNSPEIRFSTTETNSSWSIGNVNTWYDALVFKQKGLNERMILTQDGKLSIGTNPTPNEKLEVSGNIKADLFINTTQGTTNYIVVSTAIYALNGGGGGDNCGDNLGNHIATETITANYGINASSINITGTGVTGSSELFKIANSTMVVLNNGNVGIGDTMPEEKLHVNGAIRLSGIPSAVSTSGNGVIYYSSTQNKFLKSENGGSAMPLADPLVLQPPIKFDLDKADGLQTAASVSGSGIIHSIMFRIGNASNSDFNLIIDGVTIISVTNIQAGSNNNNHVLFLTPNLLWCSTGSNFDVSEVGPTTHACANANLGFGFKSSFLIKADGSTTSGGRVRVVYSLYE